MRHSASDVLVFMWACLIETICNQMQLSILNEIECLDNCLDPQILTH